MKRENCCHGKNTLWGLQTFCTRSKDPSTQVGACIVNDNNRIVSMGYNGFPSGCSDDVFLGQGRRCRR